MPSYWPSLIDVAFVCTALLFAWGGSQKGFAAQMAHVITLFILSGILFLVYPFLFAQLNHLFYNLQATYLMWILLVVVFILTIFIFVLVSRFLAGKLQDKISERADGVYGFGLGLIRGILLALLSLIFLVILGPRKYDTVFRDKSRVGRVVCSQLVPRIQPQLTRPIIKDKVDMIRESLLLQEDADVPEV